MSNDYRLLQEALDTFLRIRHWIDPDYYREQIMPTVRKIKDRLAIVETSLFMNARRMQYEHYAASSEPVRVDPPLAPPPPPQPHGEIKIDTIPQRLVEMTTTLAAYDRDMTTDHCKQHPDAPHKYLKDLSVAMGRYVCACEFWSPGSKLDK